MEIPWNGANNAMSKTRTFNTAGWIFYITDWLESRKRDVDRENILILFRVL